MAFGYKIPKFNLWGRLYRLRSTGDDLTNIFWLEPKYFRCQMKNAHGNDGFSLEVEKWTSFRNIRDTPFGLGDRIQVAGFEYNWATVYNVCDIGAGFPNEHRSLFCFGSHDDTWDSALGVYTPGSNPDLAPPEGAAMLDTTPPVDFWQDPIWYVPPGP